MDANLTQLANFNSGVHSGALTLTGIAGSNALLANSATTDGTETVAKFVNPSAGATARANLVLATGLANSEYTFGVLNSGTVFSEFHGTGLTSVRRQATSHLFTNRDASANFVTIGSAGLTFHPAAARVISGATSWTLRNDGNTVDNFSVDNATGLLTTRAGANLNGALSVAGRAFTVTNSQAFSATPTFDASLSNYFEMGALTANVTSMTISNPAEGQKINIRLIQDGVGTRTVAHPASSKILGLMGVTAGAASILTMTYSTANLRWEGSWVNLPA
jgi:hypothetical protein